MTDCEATVFVIAESRIFSRTNLALLARSTTGLILHEKYSFLHFIRLDCSCNMVNNRLWA